jgi:uncharacterized protein DUF6789
MSTKIVNGLIAGFVATVVMTLMLVMKDFLGILPALDIATMLSAMMGGAPIVVGWMAHFMIGTIVWGVAFVLFNAILPGSSQTIKGISLGVAAWAMMMVAIMPMAGAGLFGLAFGILAPMLTLMMHVIFGAVLGVTYGALPNKSASVTAAE